MEEVKTPEVPQTLEGYYVLHDVYTVDWIKWRNVDETRRTAIAENIAHWAGGQSRIERGDTAIYSVLTQKGDLMFVHYRQSPDDIKRVELEFQQSTLFPYLKPAYSYFSVIEIGLYELTAMANMKLAREGLTPGKAGFDEAFAKEMEGQKQRVQSRLFRKIPDQRYICFYPMNKRRGEQVNWYTLTLEQRRDMMRGHGRIGHKYHETVTQIIGGSIGLDDWEWGVSLHADDVLIFKKLIYEMRFDPASALYAEFGPFFVGIRCDGEQFPTLMSGGIETPTQQLGGMI